MSSTPEEDRPPEQPRWGQRRTEGAAPHQQPDPGSTPGSYLGPGHVPGYGRSVEYGESAGYGQPGGGASGYGAAQGQLQPGDGQHWQHPGGGSGPGTAPTQKPKRPMTLILAMVLMLLAGAAVLTLSVLSFLNFASADPQDMDPFWTQVAEESQAQQGPGAEEFSAQEILGIVGGMVLLGGIMLAALYTVFAFVGTMTGNVGRILATIFLAGSVFMILFGPANLIVTGLSLAAIVALWLPASNAYVRDRKAWKDSTRPGNPYGGPGQPGPQNPQAWAAPQHAPYQQQNPYQQAGPYQQNPAHNPEDNPYGGSTPR